MYALTIAVACSEVFAPVISTGVEVGAATTGGGVAVADTTAALAACVVAAGVGVSTITTCVAFGFGFGDGVGVACGDVLGKALAPGVVPGINVADGSGDAVFSRAGLRDGKGDVDGEN